MAGPIDIAYVEILPDLKKFDQEASKEISKALKGAGKEASNASKEIGKSISDSVKDGVKVAKVQLKELGREINAAGGTVLIKPELEGQALQDALRRQLSGILHEQEREFTLVGKIIGDSINKGVAESTKKTSEVIRKEIGGQNKKMSTVGRLAGFNLMDGFGGAIRSGAKGAVASFGDFLSTSFKKIDLSSLGDLLSGSKLLGGAGGGGKGGAAGAAIAAFGVSVKAAVGVIGVGLAGVLAKVGAALAISIPAAASVSVAAISTLALAFTGLDDALDNLDDNEKFQKAVEKLTPSARAFAEQVRELVPVFREIRNAAQESFFNDLDAELVKVVNTLKGPLKSGLSETGASFRELALSFTGFLRSQTGVELLSTAFSTLDNILKAAKPSLDKFLQGIGLLAIKLSPFVEKLSVKLLEVLGDIGDKFTDIANDHELNQFLDEAYDDLVLILDIAKDVAGILKDLLFGAAPGGESTLKVIKEFTAELKKLTSDRDFMEAFTTFLKTASIAILLVINGLTLLIKKFKEFLQFTRDSQEEVAKATEDVKKFVDMVKKWFEGLGGNIKLPSFNFTGLQTQIDTGLNNIVTAFNGLPTKIFNAILPSNGLIAGVFSSAWSNLSTQTTTGINDIVFKISQLPSLMFGALFPTGGLLSGLFSSTFSNLLAQTSNGVNSIISSISSVPDRLTAALGGRFFSAGASIISSFFSGISSGAAGSSGNIASSVFQSFRSGLNQAIRFLNASIARISRVIPGAISSIPEVASGGLVTGPTLATVGERGSELILPLSGQRGRSALQALQEEMGDGQAGVRRWDNRSQTIEVNITIDSGGTKMDELLVQLLRKAIRVQGGNVQKVLGQGVGV